MNALFIALCAPRPRNRNVGSFVHDMAVALRDAGHSVTVIVPVRVFPNRAIASILLSPRRWRHMHGAFAQWCNLWRDAKGQTEYDGVRYIYKRFCSSPLVDRNRASGQAFSEKNADWILRQCADCSPEFVVGHFLESAPLAKAVGRRMRIPAAVYLHESMAVLRRIVPEAALKELQNAAHGLQICVNSRQSLQEATMAGFPPEDCASIPLGVDSSIFSITTALHKGNSPFRLLYTARFVENKRHAFLIDLVYQWNSEGRIPRLQLVLLGDHSRSRLHVAEKIRRYDLVPDVEVCSVRTKSDIQKALASTHAYISPSHSESFGMALLEAAAAGIPICTGQNTGIASELAMGGIRLRTFDQYDFLDAMRALSSLIEEYPLRLKEAARIRRYVFDHFLWRHFAGEMASILGRNSSDRSVAF